MSRRAVVKRGKIKRAKTLDHYVPCDVFVRMHPVMQASAFIRHGSLIVSREVPSINILTLDTYSRINTD